MTGFTLDTSSLLGFDRDGDALWGVALADGVGPAGTGALGTAKPAGTPKPVGIEKPGGTVKDDDEPPVTEA